MGWTKRGFGAALGMPLALTVLGCLTAVFADAVAIQKPA